MSDAELRELERRFRETASTEDEVAWLRLRCRSGDELDWESYSRLCGLDVEAASEYLRWRVETGGLTRERVELAAYCGHQAAKLNQEPPRGPDLTSLAQRLDSAARTQLVAFLCGLILPQRIEAYGSESLLPLLECAHALEASDTKSLAEVDRKAAEAKARELEVNWQENVYPAGDSGFVFGPPPELAGLVASSLAATFDPAFVPEVVHAYGLLGDMDDLRDEATARPLVRLLLG